MASVASSLLSMNGFVSAKPNLPINGISELLNSIARAGAIARNC